MWKFEELISKYKKQDIHLNFRNRDTQMFSLMTKGPKRQKLFCEKFLQE